MQIDEFLLPVDLRQDMFSFIRQEEDCIGRFIHQVADSGNLDSLTDTPLALIGVNETRGAFEYYENSKGADQFRSVFYSLKKPHGAFKMADLGNLKIGNTREDTYFGLAMILEELIRKKIVPVIIGGSQDLTYAHYLAYRNLQQVINIASFDSRFDLGLPDDELTSRSYLGKIILDKPNFLFNFSCLGYQSYYVGQQAVSLMEKLYFDTCRLGQLKTDITEMEPVIRYADVLSFDLSAIRYSDAPGSLNASPNGLNGEEACQAMMYAGLSDRMAGIGLYEYYPAKDIHLQTAHLMAQMVWYFAEGYLNRKNDQPSRSDDSYISYQVSLSGNDSELIFLKSKKTDRWWMEFPMPEGGDFYSKKLLIPCSYKDYQAACRNEMPERWWQTMKKIS